MKDVNTKIDELLKTGKDYDDFMYDNSAAISEFKNKIETENDPLLKNCLKLMYVYFAQYKTADYDMNLAGGYYESVPPENEAWEIIGVAYFSYYKLIPQYKWGEIEDSFLNKSKSDFIKLQILRNKLSQAKYRMNETKLKELHELILRDFSDNEEALQLLSQYPIETKIKIGSEIPDFEVVSLDDANVKFSKKDMLGKIYMIDFWAVWCGPCVAEMDGLHKAYEKYKDKGLEILSLSFDGSSDDVIKFRKDKWKMPWKHSFVNNGFESKIAKDFEVDGIPKPILISADGKILALSNELRGEDLDKTLALYFK